MYLNECQYTCNIWCMYSIYIYKYRHSVSDCDILWNSYFMYNTHPYMWWTYALQHQTWVAVEAEASDTEVEEASDKEEQATTAPSWQPFLFRIRWRRRGVNPILGFPVYLTISLAWWFHYIITICLEVACFRGFTCTVLGPQHESINWITCFLVWE